MLLQKDYNYLRVKSNGKLQHFSSEGKQQICIPKRAKPCDQGYLHYFRGILDNFVSKLSMHGINRIFDKNMNRYKRITWIVSVLTCVWAFIYVSSRVAFDYRTKPLVTIVSDTRYPVFRIPFPEITICNRNRFNWQRFTMAQKVFLKPEHQINPTYQNLFMEVVNAYDTLVFGKFYKLENITKIPFAQLHELNYINFHLVSEFMAWKCHEILSLCQWIDDDYNCCEMFFLRNSQLGTCLAFNTIESPEGKDKQRLDPFWPWRTKDQGFYNGLKVRIHLREYNHSPMRKNKYGILVMLAEPHVWFTNPILVDTHTRTSISIRGILNTYSNYTRIFSSTIRRCLFEDEIHDEYYKSLPNHPYMLENCRSQCQQEYLVKICNCTFALFYPPGPYRHCKLVDYPCLFYHIEKYKYFEQIGRNDYNPDIMNCTCLYNCKYLNYAVKVTTAYMNDKEVVFNNSYVDLDVSFQKEYTMFFSTTVLYTWIDLIASFGGLASLCIGCSLISCVEIIYFFIIDIPCKSVLYYKMKRRLGLHRRKRDTIKVDIMENI